MTRFRVSQQSDGLLRNGTGANHGSHTARTPYSVRERPLGTTKHVRIVGIGAGASGINLVRTLRRHLQDFEITLYEKNAGVGGTWFENRYPGCRCDVPSHNYQFSWRPNPEWSNFFSPAEEIRQYLDKVCEEEDIASVVKTQHKVVGAEWDEEGGIWRLRIQDLTTGTEFDDHANFVVDASGILNNWKWPDVPGLETFQGDLIHTADWPKDYDLKGKTVAVVGNGSTGIQLVPAIQPVVEKLYHVIRTPTWVIPPRIMTMMIMGGPAKGMIEKIDMDPKENFTPAQIEKFRADPEFYREFVRTIERDINGTFPVILNNSPAQAFATQQVVKFMTASLGGDEALCKALIPTFPLGTRRITPAPGYLTSLREPNVEVLTEGLTRVVPEGIQLANRDIIKVDALICATGFDNSFKPRFPVVGRFGNIQDQWASEVPKAYMSCALPGVPNYFTFLGPNGPIGHGSVFTLSEHIARYITGIIIKCQTEGIKAIAPTDTAVDEYSEHIGAFMPRTAWSAPGRSWFKGGKEEGPVTALHPGSRIHFFHMLERFRGEDWSYTYDDAAQNRFAYLGNGFSTKELDPSVNSVWYLDEESIKV